MTLHLLTPLPSMNPKHLIGEGDALYDRILSLHKGRTYSECTTTAQVKEMYEARL